MRRATALVVAAIAWLAVALTGQVSDPHPRNSAQLTILQLNDVYSTAPIDDAGGLARVATLKARIAGEGRTPLLVMAGDFLSSSAESTVFKGEQMVAALNAAGLDLATFGNHEFDFGLDVLLQRMREARWEWIVSNILDARTGRPFGEASPYAVRTFNGLRVGFIGLCLTTAGLGREGVARLRVVNPLEAAAAQIARLKQERVDAIVALTHLTFEEDRALAERFPEIDLIVGGHEHFPITAAHEQTLISKAGTDAKQVARIDLLRRGTSRVERFHELIPITAALPDEPRTAAVVKSYADRMGAELDAVVATARVALDGVSTRLRTSETNLGNLVADVVRAEARADIGIVNSGGIRGDRVYPPGPITRRTLIEMHPFGNMICRIAAPGHVVLAALNHGVAQLPSAAGQFPQISGLTMRVDLTAPAGSRVSSVRVAGQPLVPERMYTIALPDYLLLEGDGYRMFRSQKVEVAPESGTPFVTALETHLSDWKDLSPAIDGRITITR
jgi:5'-nucleotidase